MFGKNQVKLDGAIDILIKERTRCSGYFSIWKAFFFFLHNVFIHSFKILSSVLKIMDFLRSVTFHL